MRSLRFDPARWISRLPKPAARWSRIFGLAVLVGILGGTAAAALEYGLHLGTEHLVGRISHLDGATVFRFNWFILVLPAVGGLVSGLLIHFFSPGANEHGTDLLTRAFHHDLGALPLKGPIVKGVGAVGVISTGGSAGPEGPIAALGAAIGSTCAKVFGVTPRERRVMLVAGCAAGVGAIFRCPLGGALFAAGVLYSEPEFEADAIVPAFVASVLGYSTFMLYHGFGEPLLGAEAIALRFEQPAELIAYALLGPLCGLAAILLSVSLATMEKRVVPALRMPRWLTPVVGGLLTGAVACMLPQVMDGRYSFVIRAIHGDLQLERPDVSMWWWTALFGAVMVFKCIATSFTVGSGSSGGALGPCVFIGGAAGAFMGALLEALFPSLVSEQLRQSMIPVGMAGVLAGAMRTPLAAIVMVTEMTGSYGLIVPLMLVCVSAYVVGRRWGINHEQLRTAADSPAHAADGMIHLLESLRVNQLVNTAWKPTATPGATLGELVALLKPGTRPVFAVLDGDRLVGVISVPDLHRIMKEPGLAEAVIAADIMTERITTLRPDDDLYQALNAFRRSRHDVLPVVVGERRRFIGMLTRKQVYETLRRHIDETQKLVLREHMGLHAIDQEGQMHQLVMGVSPVKTDRIQRLMVPLDAIGKNIREADLRNLYGMQVIGIEMPDGSMQFPPNLEMPLETRHRLVAIVFDREEPEADESEGGREIP